MYLLGTPRIEKGTGNFKLPGRKSLGLLAYLAINSTQAYTREHLSGYFWPSLPDKDARNNLRVAIARINKAAGTTPTTILQADRLNVQINPKFDLWVDTLEYWSMLSNADTETTIDNIHNVERETLKASAIGLCRGDFMKGFHLSDCEEFEDWQLSHREQIRVSVISTLRELSENSRVAGESALAERYTRQLLNMDPFDEGAHRRLMTLLNNNNQRNAAIEHYLLVKKRLQQDLGVQPDSDTTELFHQLDAHTDADEEAVKGERLPGFETDHNLPIDKSPYIGNQKVLAQLEQHIVSQRLITLTGIGGIGKTRLAIQVGRQCAARFADGVCFIPLASIETATETVSAIATALRIEAQAGVEPLYTIVDRLKDKRMLIILDNVEHLLESKHTVDTLLQSCAGINMLVTSRQRMQLSSEAVFPVVGLSYGNTRVEVSEHAPPASDATKLFIDAARRSRLDFNPQSADIESIQKITRLVKGHPLATVLAASWLESLSCADILEELQNDLRFLETEATDVPYRQRSVQAAFNHSWQLLDEQEQLLFASLSVFRGGFDRHASQLIAGASMRQLSQLVGKSLIEHDTGKSRYEMHELMRQFAAQKIDELDMTDDIYKKHAQYYLREITIWSRNILESFSMESRSRFDEDFDNIQIAWHRSIRAGDEFSWIPAISGIRIYCSLRGRLHNLLEMLQPVLPLIDVDGENLSDNDLKLNLLLAKGVALRQIKGYYAQELSSIFTQAYSLTDELDNSVELFVALYGQWSFNITRGYYADNLVIIDQWRERLDALDADAMKDPMVGDARFVVNMLEGPNLQCMGQIKMARHVMQGGLQLEKPFRHTALMATYGLNFSVSCRYWLSINQCMSGSIKQSEETLLQAQEIADTEQDPYLKMFTTFAYVTVFTLRKQPEHILAHVQSIKQQISNHRIFELFGHHSDIYAEYAKSLLGDRSALSRMRDLCDSEKGVPAYNVFDTHLLASVLIEANVIPEALERMDKATETLDVNYLYIHAPETLRLRALAASKTGYGKQAAQLFHDAIQAAQSQDCRLYELRACTNLCELDTDPTAAALLSSAMDYFSNQTAVPDIESAERVLNNLIR